MAFLALYLNEMRDLPQTHPAVYNEFINGNFSIRHKQGKANGVWSDLALQNNVAREEYIKIAPFLTNVSGCVKDMATSMGPEMSCHYDESKSRPEKIWRW